MKTTKTFWRNWEKHHDEYRIGASSKPLGDNSVEDRPRCEEMYFDIRNDDPDWEKDFGPCATMFKPYDTSAFVKKKYLKLDFTLGLN